MVIFKTESLREFQKKIQGIRQNNLLPVLSNIKLEYRDGKHYLTKNNLHCVCVFCVAATGECPDLLLDEDILNQFISKAKSEEIKMKWDENKIYLSDGKMVPDFARMNIVDFPPTPDYKSVETKYILTKDHLTTIGIAKSYVNNTDTAGNFAFVHLSGEFISGFHTHFNYVSRKFSGLPNMSLNGEICDTIKNADRYDIAVSDRHYFFANANCVYIFTQSESKIPNVEGMIWPRLQTTGKSFQFAKESIVDFCEMSNVINKSDITSCFMEQNGTMIKFVMKDNDRNRGNIKTTPLLGEMDRFGFDARLIASQLRAIPYETLKSKTVQNCLIISDDTGKEFFTFLGLNI